MGPEIQQKLRKIKTASIIFRAITKGLLALTAFLGLGCLVSVTLGIGGVDFDGALFQTFGLSLAYRLFLGIVTAVTWAIAVKGFYHLHRLFGNYSRGGVFTRDSVSQLRKFGIASVLWGVMSFLWLASLAISMHPAKTFRGNADASSIVLGVAIIVIAWFMDMAVDLREENELTI
ncbi:MAG TPA: DUF2975 domain-containing protein [Candidatus Acidoferrales bacterium]|nr:DUF2975 domain-containing protein [Candidatus Acidoferrales bacterium]